MFLGFHSHSKKIKLNEFLENGIKRDEIFEKKTLIGISKDWTNQDDSLICAARLC
jgi:hypothetical protein